MKVLMSEKFNLERQVFVFATGQFETHPSWGATLFSISYKFGRWVLYEWDGC